MQNRMTYYLINWFLVTHYRMSKKSCPIIMVYSIYEIGKDCLEYEVNVQNNIFTLHKVAKCRKIAFSRICEWLKSLRANKSAPNGSLLPRLVATHNCRIGYLTPWFLIKRGAPIKFPEFCVFKDNTTLN